MSDNISYGAFDVFWREKIEELNIGLNSEADRQFLNIFGIEPSDLDISMETDQDHSQPLITEVLEMLPEVSIPVETNGDQTENATEPMTPSTLLPSVNTDDPLVHPQEPRATVAHGAEPHNDLPEFQVISMDDPPVSPKEPQATDVDDAEPHQDPPEFLVPSMNDPAVHPQEPQATGTHDPDLHQNPPEFQDLSMDDVSNFIDNQRNKNTLRKTLADVNKFQRFLSQKGEMRQIQHIGPEELDQYVANFLLSIRRKDGGEYEPSSLRNIVSSLDRNLQRHQYPYAIGRGAGPQFSLTRDALKAKQKNLKKQGKGNKPHVACALTDTEIDIMHEKEVLGCSTPKSLLNTMWLNNCVHFGLRGTTEQYNLRWGDVQLKKTSEGIEFLELNERQTKTHTGENVCDVRKIAPKMFACTGPRNPIAAYKLYKSKRPAESCQPDSPFYLAPRTKKDDTVQWFLKMRVGEEKMGGMLKEMAKDAGLNDDKNITNHSARKYLVQKLRDNNVPPTDIMHVSGHKSITSVLNYSEISVEQQMSCSNLLSVTGKPAETAPSCSSNDCRSVVVSGGATSAFPHPPPPLAQIPSSQSQNNAPSQNTINALFHGAVLNVLTLNLYTGNVSNP